jgi:hypothetical protein
MIAGWFGPAAFRETYGRVFPRRNPVSILPSDYCFNRDNRGNAAHPRFLDWDGTGAYRFVGLDGEGDVAAGFGRAVAAPIEPNPDTAASTAVPAGSPKRAVQPPKARHRRAGQSRSTFSPAAGRSLALDLDIAAMALRAYNADHTVLEQERQAFAALGDGFRRGSVAGQLRALDSAYSTRSVGDDLATIAAAVERTWDDWSGRLAVLPPLTERPAGSDEVRAALAPFLASETRRLPRSLATKALHFARPTSFIPADLYAVDRLGRELAAGSWTDTQSLDLDGMAQWYASYLRTIHLVFAANAGSVPELLALDAASGDEPAFVRVRGWTKVVDKILWWLGREARSGREHRLFR